MQNFLIGHYDGVLIYGSENDKNELEIKFIEIPPLCDITPLDILNFRDFRQGYIRLADFEMRRYGNYIYCRIYASMFRIDMQKGVMRIWNWNLTGYAFWRIIFL